MRQFLDVKARHPDGIVFFRMGDFFEMFFDDAVVASQLLDLTLTSRDKGKEDAIPMAGFPHHASKGYIHKLTSAGKKVVVVEQLEDPRFAKGIVKRDVVQIITPGIVVDDQMLDPAKPRYVAALATHKDRAGLAYLDASTGEFRATRGTRGEMVAELGRICPHEVVFDTKDMSAAELGQAIRGWAERCSAAVTHAVAMSSKDAAQALGPWVSPEQSVSHDLAVRAAAMVWSYAQSTQPAGQIPVQGLALYERHQTLVLDETCVANLELLQTLMGQKKNGALLGVLDATKTAKGSRLLRNWLLSPLLDKTAISARHDAVGYLVERASLRAQIRDSLAKMPDIERVAGRVCLGVASPRDLAVLGQGLAQLPELAARLMDVGVPELVAPVWGDQDGALAGLAENLNRAISDTAPLVSKDGGFIRDGFCPIIDEQRGLAQGGREAILAIEERERARTQISTLKVKYNRVFGYYIEVTRSQLARVPSDYVRKQTIVGGERYVTPELAELEQKILSASENVIAREHQIFSELKQLVIAQLSGLLAISARLAQIDVLASLADVAHRRRYCRPTFVDGRNVKILGGRHPVVEAMSQHSSFVANDCVFAPPERQMLLITGPNMAGKSTYMRQIAHIVILAQMGSFVPADSATMSVVDRIFTRVGASDNLARGESTFMVEMRETAEILAGATKDSLVLLDEVGRGTSTFDGISIAWAVAEHLHNKVGCKTLFATHYHELCKLSETCPGIRNVSVTATITGGKIVFLREIAERAASRSYGVEVAQLAGLPKAVIARASGLLRDLENGAPTSHPQLGLDLHVTTSDENAQIAYEHPIVKRLKGLDAESMTPLQALLTIAELSQVAHQSDS